MPKKTTASQRFAQIFALFTNGTTQGEREAAERKLDAWLKRHGKTRADIASILIQAAADDAAVQPPHPLTMNEQAGLLAKVGIRSVKIRPPGARQGRGYKLAQFQDAWRKHGTPAPGEAEAARGRLRLIASEPD
jgi:hypothetical protein